MAEEFLRLSTDERSQILRAKARALGRGETVLEKDVWVCWALREIFAIEGLPRLAFKGGTSLSKVFGAIHRFSEDVDVTFDYRDVRKGLGYDDDPGRMSGERLRKFQKALQEATRKLVLTRVLPRFQEAMTQLVGAGAASPQVDDSGEKLLVPYPSVLERDGYLREHVLLEFGGRNLTEPRSTHRIAPDIAEHISELAFPVAEVSVLAPERTFWEKATLIHAECCRGSLRAEADRPSRHWSDLALLADHDIGRRALKSRDLFSAVVQHKTWAFRDAKARYDLCLNGGLRLIPTAESMKQALRDDFEAMVRARLFTREPQTFSEIEERLSGLAEEINGSA